jgi:hypothetical protein
MTIVVASVDDTLNFVDILIFTLKEYLISKFQYTLIMF